MDPLNPTSQAQIYWQTSKTTGPKLLPLPIDFLFGPTAPESAQSRTEVQLTGWTDTLPSLYIQKRNLHLQKISPN